MITSKIEFLKNLLSGFDLKKSVVLDVGTGKTSVNCWWINIQIN